MSQKECFNVSEVTEFVSDMVQNKKRRYSGIEYLHVIHNFIIKQN